MAYRDPTAAALVRLSEAREAVAALEERMTPALLEHLPDNLTNQLAGAGAAAEQALHDGSLEGVREAVQRFSAYAALLVEAIERAPKLARKFNRLPRAFPDRTAPRFDYHFPDIFATPLSSLRDSLHAAIDAIDPKARLFDKRAGYFDSLTTPYLVEACFRVDYDPLRLQVTAWHQEVYRTTGTHAEVTSEYCLLTGVRPSTPELKLTVDNLKAGFLSLFGLLRDSDLGDAEIDRAFVVDADPEDAKRVLRPEVMEALRLLMKHGEISLVEVRDGLARIEWREDVSIRTRVGRPVHPFECSALTPAVALLRGIRATPPTPLLRDLERRRGRKKGLRVF